MATCATVFPCFSDSHPRLFSTEIIGGAELSELQAISKGSVGVLASDMDAIDFIINCINEARISIDLLELTPSPVDPQEYNYYVDIAGISFSDPSGDIDVGLKAGLQRILHEGSSEAAILFNKYVPLV